MKKTIWFRILLVVSSLVAISSCNTAEAQTSMTAAPVKLAWNASPGAVSGYAVYYHLVGSSITNRLDVGPAQTATVANLEAGSAYIFWVAAYDDAGVESPSPDVLLYSPPALSRLRISRQVDGTMSIQFRAAAGSLSRVEYATTPTSPQWRTLGSATADANGNVLINDPPSSRPPTRFYRGMRL